MTLTSSTMLHTVLTYMYDIAYACVQRCMLNKNSCDDQCVNYRETSSEQHDATHVLVCAQRCKILCDGLRQAVCTT